MEELFNALRRVIFGYDMNNPKDKASKENLEQANENVQDNKDRNDGVYDPTEPVIEAITGIPQELQNFNWIIGGFAVVIFILLIKE
jgi:hypothetical protein